MINLPEGILKSKNMEVKIKNGEEMIDATIEMVDGVMVVSPKVEKFEPKDGDVCVHDGMIYIFKGVKPSSICSGKSAIIHHCYYDVETLQVKEDVGCGYIDCSQRFATEEEKKKLFDKLKEEGYEWDAEKKELAKLKWNPVLGEVYFRIEFVDHEFRYADWNWKNSTYEIEAYERGWCFKTKEECQEFCNRLNDAINSVKL
jgi:hypothetical protein